jgi:nucleoside phosphorylase
MRELTDFLRGDWQSSTLARFCEAVDAGKITVKAVSDECDAAGHVAP